MAHVGEASLLCSFRAMVAGDLDGDGFADAVAALNLGSTIKLLAFPGKEQVSTEAAFVQQLGKAEGFTTSMVAAGDLNGDGFDDVGFGGEQGGDLYLGKRGPGAPLFAAAGGGPMDGFPAPAGDVNGDGFDDIVNRGNPVPIYFGGGGINFNTTADAWLSPIASGSGFGAVVAIVAP